MLSFLLVAASAWFIGSALFHAFRGTAPKWMQNRMYKDRKFQESDNRNYTATGGFWSTYALLLMAAVLILMWNLSALFYYSAWEGFRNNLFLSVSTIALTLFVPVFVGRNINRAFSTYGRQVYQQEQREELKQAYGAKDWATYDQIGQSIPPFRIDGKPAGIHIGEGWHWYDKGHMLTVGGSGQGKGVNLILPALLSDGFVAAGISLVCLDPKGENAAIAAPHLQRSGYDVHVLNPSGIAEIAQFGNARFNPFDLIDANDDNASKLYDVLAMALHNRRGQGDNSFFDNRCRQYIALYLAYAHHIGKGDFSTVYNWLRLSGEERAVLLAEMMSAADFEEHDTAKAILSRLTGDAAKTEENIYGTVEEATNLLKNKGLRASLSQSDFDLRTIAQKPTAIFVCIPFEELDYYAPWVRLFFNFLLRTLTKHYNPERKVLVLLDEFPQLSYMDEVPRSMAVLRGYNVTLWPVVQNLGQLKDIYGEKWETFISSSIIKHWLSAGTDNTTADYLSKRLPLALRFIGMNPDGSPKVVESSLLNANQTMGFKQMICEIANMDIPAKFDKAPYWTLPFSRDNATKNPFYS